MPRSPSASAMPDVSAASVSSTWGLSLQSSAGPSQGC